MMFRVGVLASAIGLLLLAACIQVAPTPEPTGPPTPITRITREQAIQIALSRTGSQPELTAVENPRNPVARLMRLDEYYKSWNRPFPPPDTLVWVVQFEGTSYSAGPGEGWPRTQYNYAVVVLDAEFGGEIGGSRLREPFFS